MDENIQLKAAISAMNVPCEHQWDNVMVSDDKEDYICRKCMAHGVKALKEGAMQDMGDGSGTVKPELLTPPHVEGEPHDEIGQLQELGHGD